MLDVRMSACFLDVNNAELCQNSDFLIANHGSGKLPDSSVALAWNGTRFSSKGRTTLMGSQGARSISTYKARSTASGNELSWDWHVEILDFPLTLTTGTAGTCSACDAYFTLQNAADWRTKVKIHKMSTWGSLNGQPRESRRFTRVQSMTRAGATLEVR